MSYNQVISSKGFGEEMSFIATICISGKVGREQGSVFSQDLGSPFSSYIHY